MTNTCKIFKELKQLMVACKGVFALITLVLLIVNTILSQLVELL